MSDLPSYFNKVPKNPNEGEKVRGLNPANPAYEKSQKMQQRKDSIIENQMGG